MSNGVNVEAKGDGKAYRFKRQGVLLCGFPPKWTKMVRNTLPRWRFFRWSMGVLPTFRADLLITGKFGRFLPKGWPEAPTKGRAFQFS